MDVEQTKQYCRAFQGVLEQNTGHPSNVLVFRVDKKKFAYFKTSAPEQWRFSIRVDPDLYLGLTDQPGIKPARYMHRYHWVTIINVQAVDERFLKELICWSYEKALVSLSKKTQKNLLESSSSNINRH